MAQPSWDPLTTLVLAQFHFTNVVGLRAEHGDITDFIRKLRLNPDEMEILGNGKQRKSYLHVKEFDRRIFRYYAHARKSWKR